MILDWYWALWLSRKGQGNWFDIGGSMWLIVVSIC